MTRVARTPYQRGVAMKAGGHHRWVLGVTMTKAMLKADRDWYLGVKVRHTMHKVRVHLR